MHSKIGVVFGALLAVVAFAAFAATAGATTITPAATATAVTGNLSFVSNNGMGAAVVCSTVNATATTPTAIAPTPNNNAGDTTTPGSVGFTIGTPTFTNCIAGGAFNVTIATNATNGGWFFNAETYPSGAIVGVLAFPKLAATMDFTGPAGLCHIDIAPTMVGEMQGLWTNGAGGAASTLAMSKNQVEFTGNAGCTGIGITNGIPMQFTVALAFSAGVQIGM